MRKTKEKENERVPSPTGVEPIRLTRAETEVVKVVMSKGLPPHVDTVDGGSKYKAVKLNFEKLREACLDRCEAARTKPSEERSDELIVLVVARLRCFHRYANLTH